MHKNILRLAIPNIISNLSVPLLSSVDTALMGRQDSVSYIGAVAIGSLIFNFIYWSFGFLRMGTTGLTAQALGKNDKTSIINTLGRALMVALIGSLLLIVLQIPLANLSFNLLDASVEVETYAKDYFKIRIWAAPATLALYAFMGWFFGLQNAIYPMILTIIINIINIFCSFYFVNVLDMKAEGVALGTVIAQYVGLLLAVGFLVVRYKEYFPYFRKDLMLKLEAFRQFMALNGDIFIRTFCLVFAFAFFDNESAKQGDVILAVNAVLLQFVTWISYGIDGFGFASESLVGKYLGAKDDTNLNKAIRYSFIWALAFSVIYSLTYALFGIDIIKVFTDQAAVIYQAQEYLIWLVVFPIVAMPCYIWDGIYIGYTASKQMRNTMLVVLAGYLVIYYLQDALFDLGNHGLWLSLVIFMGLRGVVQWIVFKSKIA